MPRTLVFSTKAFGTDAIKKAAYRLSDVLSVEIMPGDDVIECALHFGAEQSPEEEERLIAAFRNEVLDQDLRERIGEETAAVRNVILAYALSKTGLQGE